LEKKFAKREKEGKGKKKRRGLPSGGRRRGKKGKTLCPLEKGLKGKKKGGISLNNLPRRGVR